MKPSWTNSTKYGTHYATKISALIIITYLKLAMQVQTMHMCPDIDKSKMKEMKKNWKCIDVTQTIIIKNELKRIENKYLPSKAL